MYHRRPNISQKNWKNTIIDNLSQGVRYLKILKLHLEQNVREDKKIYFHANNDHDSGKTDVVS